MKKVLFALLIYILVHPLCFAADTMEGSAITPTSDIEGHSANIDDVEGSEIAAGGGGPIIDDDFSTDTIGNYDQESGTWSVDGGADNLVAPSGGDDFIRHETTVTSAAHWACAVLNYGASDYPGIVLRMTDTFSDNHYWLFFDPANTKISWAVYASGSSVQGSVDVFNFSGLDTGDELCVSVTGTNTSTAIEIWIGATTVSKNGDGSPAGAADDTLSGAGLTNFADAGTYVGMGSYETNAITFDDFTAGN